MDEEVWSGGCVLLDGGVVLGEAVWSLCGVWLQFSEIIFTSLTVSVLFELLELEVEGVVDDVPVVLDALEFDPLVLPVMATVCPTCGCSLLVSPCSLYAVPLLSVNV